MAWRIVFIVVVWVASFSDGDKLFPKPSLTQHRSRVMRLECKPPPEAASDWLDVHDIRVFICPPRYDICTNHTVASMTSAMTAPRRGSVLPSIAKVTFSGSWTPAESSLTVETPFSSENYGVYYCTSEYSSSEGIRKYSAGLSVDDSSDTRRSALTRDRFEVQILKAHAVNVTWRPPDDSEFLEGRVTRSFVDREGKVTTSPRSLFMATATDKDVVFDSAGVLLTQFETPSSTGQNYTMRVYVDSQMCTPFCRYSCSVPYHACVGPDAVFCECNLEENVASPAAASAGLSKGGIGAICLAVLIVVFAVLIIVLVILLRRGEIPRLKTLLDAPTATDERNIGTGTQTEHIELTANQQATGAHAKPDGELSVSLPHTPGTPSGPSDLNSDLTKAIHPRDEDGDGLKKGPTNHPSNDAHSPEEPEAEGASGGEHQPLLAPEPTHDTNPAGTEKKNVRYSSKERAAHPSRNSGSGGARYKDTHQNPDASFSSQPNTNTSRTDDRSPLASSTSRHFDYSNPIQDQVNTSEQHQTKTEFDHGTRGEHTTGNDYPVSPRSALKMRTPSDTAEQRQSVTEESRSESKEVP